VLLEEYGYNNRLVTINQAQLPLVAEVYESGQSTLCQLRRFTGAGGAHAESKVVIEIDPGVQKVVDLGQITTIWIDTPGSDLSSPLDLRLSVPKANAVENVLDALYRSRRGRARSGGLNKKQIVNVVSKLPLEVQFHAQSLLRKLQKVGVGSARLIDSEDARSSLFLNGANTTVSQRAIAATLLATDANTGGRFKRWPCAFLSSSAELDQVTLVNGGWLCADNSVRVGQEARKFVDRINTAEKNITTARFTVADERIARRLECLAMGEIMSRQNADSAEEEVDLQLDVRDTLKAMNLPVSPSGAEAALIRIGRWSEREEFKAPIPWSSDIVSSCTFCLPVVMPDFDGSTCVSCCLLHTA
jgi:hypothetical protein